MQMYYKKYIMRFKVHWKSNHCILDLAGSNQFAGLKLNIHKMKIMTSSLITSWQIDGETMETVRDFIFLAPKSLQVVTAAMKSKDTYSLEEKL